MKKPRLKREVSGTRKSPREPEATAQELDPWRMGVLEFQNTPVVTAVLAWPGLWGTPGTAWFFPTSPRLFVENPASLP